MTSELFDDLANIDSEVNTIEADKYMAGGFDDYDWYISDHRPVAMKLMLSPTTSSNELEPSSAINLYPNPVGHTNEIHIDLGETKRSIEIRLLEASGRSLHSARYFDSSRIQLPVDVLSGVYFLEVLADSERSVSKIIKL